MRNLPAQRTSASTPTRHTTLAKLRCAMRMKHTGTSNTVRKYRITQFWRGAGARNASFNLRPSLCLAIRETFAAFSVGGGMLVGLTGMVAAGRMDLKACITHWETVYVVITKNK
jgi:hypothetical protein